MVSDSRSAASVIDTIPTQILLHRYRIRLRYRLAPLARNVYWSQRANLIEFRATARSATSGWGGAAWTFIGAGALGFKALERR